MRVETVTPAGIQRNATVLIDGEPVGTTGRDGTLWTVRPSGTFTLTVVGEDGATASLGRTQFLRVP
jgi:membrane carboxypeptidase/penicillin-binding protein PbpC